jgi:hypothetical protein
MSRSNVMDLGSPCSQTTSLKKRWAIWDASKVFTLGMKCDILENLSITTKIESITRWVLSIQILLVFKAYDLGL